MCVCVCTVITGLISFGFRILGSQSCGQESVARTAVSKILFRLCLGKMIGKGRKMFFSLVKNMSGISVRNGMMKGIPERCYC